MRNQKYCKIENLGKSTEKLLILQKNFMVIFSKIEYN